MRDWTYDDKYQLKNSLYMVKESCDQLTIDSDLLWNNNKILQSKANKARKALMEYGRAIAGLIAEEKIDLKSHIEDETE